MSNLALPITGLAESIAGVVKIMGGIIKPLSLAAGAFVPVAVFVAFPLLPWGMLIVGERGGNDISAIQAVFRIILGCLA